MKDKSNIMLNEKDLPVGVELVETEDMYGVPCIELVIQCANKEIALDYYQSIQSNYEIVQRLKDSIVILKKQHEELWNKGVVQGDRQKKIWLLDDKIKLLKSILEKQA